MEKGKQIAMAIDYSSWQNHSHWNLTNNFFKQTTSSEINNCQIEISQTQKHIEGVTTQKPDASKITQVLPPVTQDHTAGCV